MTHLALLSDDSQAPGRRAAYESRQGTYNLAPCPGLGPALTAGTDPGGREGLFEVRVIASEAGLETLCVIRPVSQPAGPAARNDRPGSATRRTLPPP
jgi:hypothetical protein